MESLTAITSFIGDTIIALFVVAIIVAISIHFFGWPGYWYSKLLQSKFGKDVLLPLKLAFRKLR